MSYFYIVLKKAAAILFLLLLLFNFVGYRAWFYYVQIQSNQRFQASLNKNDYNDQDLITIRVPLSLPYFTDWKEFESYDGSIEVDGKHYNYVKRKVSNDTLILLCIPNHEQNKLSDNRNEYEKLLNDVRYPAPGNKANSSALLLSSLLAVYNKETSFCQPDFFYLQIQQHKLINENAVCDCIVAPPWHPPRLIS